METHKFLVQCSFCYNVLQINHTKVRLYIILINFEVQNRLCELCPQQSPPPPPSPPGHLSHSQKPDLSLRIPSVVGKTYKVRGPESDYCW